MHAGGTSVGVKLDVLDHIHANSVCLSVYTLTSPPFLALALHQTSIVGAEVAGVTRKTDARDAVAARNTSSPAERRCQRVTRKWLCVWQPFRSTQRAMPVWSSRSPVLNASSWNKAKKAG